MPRNILPFMLATCLGAGLFVAAGCNDEQDAATEAVSFDIEPWFPAAAGGAMESPLRMVATKKGKLLVSDSRDRMILLVDPATLQAEQALAIDGKPLGVSLIGKRLIVGNATKRTIEVYDVRGGKLQRSFGAGVVEYPVDLAVDETLGLIFVVDGARREVKVFDTRGRLRGTIAGPGAGASALQAPTGVGVDPLRREVYVSDYGYPSDHAAIKIFDYDGNFVDEISGAGSCGMLGCSGGFSRPQGLTADGQGKIYLADALLAQVLVYDRETLEQLEVLGGRDQGLRLPLDVAVIGVDLYVTSNRTGTVEVFPGAGGQP